MSGANRAEPHRSRSSSPKTPVATLGEAGRVARQGLDQYACRAPQACETHDRWPRVDRCGAAAVATEDGIVVGWTGQPKIDESAEVGRRMAGKRSLSAGLRRGPLIAE